MFYLIKIILEDFKYTSKTISMKGNFCAPFLCLLFPKKIYSKCKKKAADVHLPTPVTHKSSCING